MNTLWDDELMRGEHIDLKEDLQLNIYFIQYVITNLMEYNYVKGQGKTKNKLFFGVRLHTFILGFSWSLLPNIIIGEGEDEGDGEFIFIVREINLVMSTSCHHSQVTTDHYIHSLLMKINMLTNNCCYLSYYSAKRLKMLQLHIKHNSSSNFSKIYQV